jgi:acyl-CoA synthetase (AMP-forming)/AMP-acid ligase II
MANAEQRTLSWVAAAAAVELSHDTVGDVLSRLARDAPDDPALRWLTDTGTGAMTWSQLYQHASGAASALLRMNPHRRRVALVSFNSVDWIVAMFGCALAGMPVVPIAASVIDSEAEELLTLARVGVILAVKSVADDPVLDRMRVVAKTLSPRPVVCAIGEINAATTQVVGPDSAVRGADEFLLQFTSGTTGTPKAASLSHRAAINSARIYAQACGAQPGDCWLNPLPLYHVGGSVSGLVVTLAYGGVYIVIERFSSQVLLRALREIRPALLGLVPTMVIDLLALPTASASDFSSVRLVIGGAAAVDPALIDDMESRLGITFGVAYGQSEAPMMAASSPGDSASVRSRTLGRCLPGRDYRVIDRTGNVVPIGSLGELCVRGPLIMSGYLQPDGTLDPALDNQGWLCTGDLCCMDDEGVLTFGGRIREVIIRGGANVYPAEVEQALQAHAAVAEAAVFGVADKRLGERVVAAVILAGDGVDSSTLASFAQSKLSRHKRPTEWICAKTLPRTSTGKVRKHLLQQWYEDGTLQGKCVTGVLP